MRFKVTQTLNVKRSYFVEADDEEAALAAVDELIGNGSNSDEEDEYTDSTTVTHLSD